MFLENPFNLLSGMESMNSFTCSVVLPIATIYDDLICDV